MIEFIWAKEGHTGERVRLRILKVRAQCSAYKWSFAGFGRPDANLSPSELAGLFYGPKPRLRCCPAHQHHCWPVMLPLSGHDFGVAPVFGKTGSRDARLKITRRSQVAPTAPIACAPDLPSLRQDGIFKN